MNEKINFFYRQSEIFVTAYGKLNEKLKIISILRILVFILFLIAVTISANYSNLLAVIISTLIFIVAFPLLVKWHNMTQYQANHFQLLQKINEDEILRLKGSLEHFDPGTAYLNIDHPYNADLDIFGKNSMYQLLNRCSTFWGKNTLANWISFKAEKKEISLRQESIKELSKDIEWLQEFQATGMHFEGKTDIKPFLKWLKTDNFFLGSALYQAVRFISPIITLSILGLVIFSVISWQWIILTLVINGLIILRVLSNVKAIHDNTSVAIKSLKGLEALIKLVEKASFNTLKNKEIQAVYIGEGKKVSSSIGSLNRILQHLDNRDNQIYHLFNLFLLLDLQFSFSAEKWKSTQPENISMWFEAMGEMEGLTSLAGFAFSNPDYVFPEILGREHTLEARELGHPLIPYATRVSNDFHLIGKGDIAIITGSNMAGKSTFLRTIGVNIVLALTGAPVCARKLSVTPIQVFSSMRSQDNLEENISSFYAELKRIQQLLTLTNKDTPVFFLLDEILKGTNSHDRHLGAVSLVHQLSEKNTSGLISTHDIDLAKESTKGRNVANYSFNSTIEGDEILFDYKLTKGICKSFNASKLMKKMGIQIIE